MNHLMTKPTKWLCAQWRLRSAWASPQSDQSLRCSHEETLGPQLPTERTVKTLIRLGWSEYSLGAHTIVLVLSCGGSNERKTIRPLTTSSWLSKLCRTGHCKEISSNTGLLDGNHRETEQLPSWWNFQFVLYNHSFILPSRKPTERQHQHLSRTCPRFGWAFCVFRCNIICFKIKNAHPSDTLAIAWQKQQNHICTRRRLRSAWAFAQSDHSLCYSLWG